MNKILRLFATATLSGLLAFVVTAQGCSTEAPGGGTADAGGEPKCTDPNDYTTCTCDVKSDCTPNDASKAKYFVCTPRKTCVKICFAKSDCAADELCEDSQCRKPACGDDTECGANEQCIAGACKGKIPATDVASCSVAPASALLHAGSTKSFNVVTKNADGKVIPFHGDVTWTADVAVGTVAGANATATLTGAAGDGAGKITASVNGKTCTADVTNFAAAEAGKFRIVVASFADQSLIKGAKVVLSDDNDDYEAETDANGVATFDSFAAPGTVSVFAKDFTYVTYVGVTKNDTIAYLKPAVKTGKLKGEFTPRTFDKLQDVKGTVHLAISGPSIAGNVLDLSLSTLLGESVPTTIDLGGSTKTDLDLPDGISIGLAENMFKGKFGIQSAAGLRTGWSLGGNVVLSDVLGVVSQATGGGDIDIGAILSSLLPVLGRLQAGAFAGLEFKANETGQLPADFGPTTLLRLQSKVKVPTLTSYKIGETVNNFEGAIVLAGALYGSEGLVPLGLSAGVDKDKNGKVDAVMGGSGEGEVALRFAPQNGGIEGSKTVALSLAASFSGLVGGDGESGPLVLSGRVAYPGKILFKDNATNSIDLGSAYLGVPDVVTIDEASRKLTISNLADAKLFRLDVGSDENEWQVYFPAGTTEVTVPSVPATFDDHFVGTEAGKLPEATLQSISVTDGIDFQSVVEFDSNNTDDLTQAIDAFSARGIDRVAP